MARLLQRFPGQFQELAVLGVHDGGFLGRQPEELGIEMVEIIEGGGERHIIGMCQQMRGHAGLFQGSLVLLPDCADTFAKVLPICCCVFLPTWKANSQTYDGNAIIVTRTTHVANLPKYPGAHYARFLRI